MENEFSNSIPNNSCNHLAINLSCISAKPTGISNYIKNLFPHLKIINPVLLSSESYPDFDCHTVPSHLTSDYGRKGHLNRLLWTQFKMPKILNRVSGKLLFSPIPEAPLFLGFRFVTTAFDLIPLRFPNYKSPLFYYQKYYTKEVFKQAQHIVCISESTANDVMHFYDIPSKKITPILLAYDAQHFQPHQNQEDISCAQKKYFLYVGRHDHYKNINRLIEAFSKLSFAPDYQLWIVGPKDPRYTPELQQQAQELGLHNDIQFLDYVSYQDLPKIISGAIALVFPSLWEGFGLPVLEAMGCGTPVITSNLSSLPEVAGDAAILIDPYNVEEIADAMRAIANDSALRASLSEKGLARASQFSWEKTGRETVEVLQRFL